MSWEVICPRCGTVNPGAARFCSNCGLERPLGAGDPATPGQPAPPSPPPVASKRGPTFRNVALILVALLVVGVVASQVIGGVNPGPQGRRLSTPSTSPVDAQTEAKMIENLREMDFEGIGTSPELAVRDGVLMVSMLGDHANAAALCRSVAAVTNDPDTAEPLGVKRVVIISGGRQVADCERY